MAAAVAARMKLRRLLSVLTLIGTAAVIGAVYSPDLAERLAPGTGLKVKQLRLLVPGALLAKIGFETAGGQPTPGAVAAKPARPPVTVLVAQTKRGSMPVRIDAIGTVQPISSVALRSRVDAQIDRILVVDGSEVKAGEVLIKLDSRQLEAQIKQAEAALAKDKATLEQAQRDVLRDSALVSKQAGTQLTLDNAKTAVASAQAAIMGDQAAIDNLAVQLTWYTISAPVSGRVGTVALKAGNIVRSGDNGTTGILATINQIAPIYVAFSVPQRLLNDLRKSLHDGGAETIAIPQGTTHGRTGRVAVLDNAIDATTGTVMVRAIFDNTDEFLWPGQLCDVRLTLRIDPDVVSVPRQAVQVGQDGNFVFIVEDGIAHVRKVTVARTQDGADIISAGLSGDETVVTEGALLLIEGAQTEIRNSNKKDAS
jgi:RND family efflux transporter MFP subunit